MKYTYTNNIQCLTPIHTHTKKEYIHKSLYMNITMTHKQAMYLEISYFSIEAAVTSSLLLFKSLYPDSGFLIKDCKGTLENFIK